MADIDERFITTSDVDTYYVDKDTGRPLAAGKVTFYSDVNRTVKKPVYQLTGAPGAYTYEPLPNPSTLSSVGTFQDEAGNNIVPYYFPYEGLPELTNNKVERYYITVESALGVDQLTRQAWPNDAGGESGGDSSRSINYIPNGQFLLHNNIVTNSQPPTQTFGNFTAQPIAQGGWVFLRSVAGSSVFENSFEEIESEISGINDYPRVAFNFKCASFNSSDAVRDVAISWPDVNKFSAGDPEGSAPYTFMIEAESNDSNTYVFDVRLIRYFGTGGLPSATSDTSIGTFTVTPASSYFRLFIAGIAGNTGTLGTNNDDRIFISLRGPTSTWNIKTTSWVFVGGEQNLEYFPTMTNAQMVSDSLMGWVTLPNPNGAQLYLKPVLTLQGMDWDAGEIGQIVTIDSDDGFNGSVHTTTNLLIMDGNAYLGAGYSPLGIPYARLQDHFWNADLNMPRYGTGIDFVSCYFTANGSLRITTNNLGAQTVSTDGTSPTGFTISTIFAGTSPGPAMLANLALNESTIILQSIGTGFNVDDTVLARAHTSGFTVNVIYPNAYSGDSATNFLYTIEVPALPGAGTYFTFENASGTSFYVWFKIDGSGSDPAPGGTGILVPLLSTYSIFDANSVIIAALNGYQATSITTVAASAMTEPCYFQFTSNAQNYIITYYIDGTGSTFVGGINIPVDLDAGDDAETVASKTLLAINRYQFATPNAQNMILKMVNAGADNTLPEPPDDFGLRWGLINTTFSDNPQGYGTYQYSDNRAHTHTVVTNPTLFINAVDAGSLNAFAGDQIASEIDFIATVQGGTESRPPNFGVCGAIRY